MTASPLFKTAAITSLALIAFALNSVLCRMALGSAAIDAASFTVIRLLSGSIMLLIIISFGRHNRECSATGSWTASLMLFIYALTFSFAYLSLDTGTGALILFGSVQITMILVAVISGVRLHYTEWSGVIIAFSGFVYLILPAVSTPSFSGLFLMTAAGIAWAIYTLKGRGSVNPLMDTAFNFFRTTPLILLLTVITLSNAEYSAQGIILAVLSGAITSAIGYTLWYFALASLSSTQAAVLQLSVPVIAAAGGVIFISEAITLRFTVSTTLVLGGILLVVVGKEHLLRRPFR
ncbi:MAG: DMT family transporter [Gammaproteobacteria bacterium]|nr:DMT family transporter [Gammaproteobacteria bacterium]